MQKTILSATIGALLIGCTANPDPVQTAVETPVKTPVTWENYVAAETEIYFNEVMDQVGVNTFIHNDAVSIENQNIIRSNRDVYYSLAIVDVSEGATLTVPASDNFQIIHVMDENHLLHAVVDAGESKTFKTGVNVDTNFVYLLARTKIGTQPEQSKAQQQLLKIEANSAKPYVGERFDAEEAIAFRAEVLNKVLAGEVPVPTAVGGFRETYSEEFDNDYVSSAAVGWGGLPPTEANYAPAIVGQGGTECSQVTFPVPTLQYDNKAYYSITTYDLAGWVATDNFYIGNDDMQQNDDGTATVYFNCPDIENSLTVVEDWTAVYRMYRPVDVEESINYVEEFFKNVKVELVK